MSKIIGNPVGTTLPKPDWKQTDPTKGDYIKNKPDVDALQNLVGDTPVADQISEAMANVKTIIDVTELPTEDINEGAFYRLLTGSLVFNQYVQHMYTCYCVETLPATGEPATNLDQTAGNVYYNLADGEPYGYVDDMLSMGLGVPAGWYLINVLLEALGYTYSGVITNMLDDPQDGAFRFLLEYIIYSYKDGWVPYKTIGNMGTGVDAETFNHLLNVANGAYSHAECYMTTANGEASHAEGSESATYGYASHAEGANSRAEGYASHAEGANSHAEGTSSHAEGNSSHAEGTSSHAEGTSSHAQGHASHAEGCYTHAQGESSHAEGYKTHAEGYHTHAEGRYSHAEGESSHAEGWYSHAVGKSQHVQGEYNIVDSDYNPNTPHLRAKYAHIVGNGTDENQRSNAHTLDWDGNAWFQGEVKIGGTGQDDATAKTLATTEDVYAVKNDLLNGAGAAYDTLKELGDLIDDNTDAIEALETIAGNKANASDLTAHTGNKNNPHGVTAEQIGAAAASEVTALKTLVGDKAVATQISEALANTTQVQFITWEADD